jgi:iron complex outermembrane receptor protein
MALQDEHNRKTAGLLLRTARAVIAIAITGSAGAAPSTGVPKFDFRIEQDTVARELRDFNFLTHTTMLYDSSLNMRGQGVHGRYTAEEALTRILRDTGLTCIHVNGGPEIVVRPSTDADQGPRSRCLNPQQRPLTEEGPTPTANKLPAVYIRGSRLGTHIHGLSQIGSAVIAWDEEQIRRSGAQNLSDLLSTMTQNFGGGPNQHTHFGQVETYTNSGLGASVNLRGLGARATLVLVNGRRIAPSGSAAAFVDLLNIPLSAVKEVDVLLDGASAIYGSDAVGGVVNILTKDEYIRPQTVAEVGSVTNGRQEQHRIAQELGTRWDGGNLVVVGEVMHRGALAANERWQNSSDLSPRGPNEDVLYANPGNLLTALGYYPIPARPSGRLLDFSTLAPGPLNLADRYAGADVVPDQSRWSLFASLHQALGESSTFFSDVLWTQRYALERDGGQEVELNVTNSPFWSHPPQTQVLEYYNLLDALGPEITAVNVRTLNTTLGIQVDLLNQWHLVLTGSDVLESENQVTSGEAGLAALQAAVSNPDPAVAFDPLGAGSNTAVSTLEAIEARQWYGSRSQLWDFAATADGSFLSLPAGPLHEALGIEYRDQRFSTGASQASAEGDLRRQLYAGFAELVAPVLNATAYPAPWRAVTLSLAGRIEDYSDVGEAATPRVGLTWEPIAQLAVRATWGRSIRAPDLADLAQQNNISYVQSLGGTPALIWTGGNASLSVERALTRTIGLSFKSDEVARFTADVGYFDILFRDRIQPSALVPDILTNPEYASFVTHNPSSSAQESVCDQSQFLGIGTCLQVPIKAIVNLRELNAATLWTDGLDIRFGTHFETPLGRWGLSIASTYILHYEEANTPNEPLVSLLNTLSNPIALHASATTTWKIGNAETSLDIRYSNRYRDLQTQPATQIASWTTADLRFAYTFNSAAARGSHPTEISLNCTNLFNRYSPFAINKVAGLGYDQENGDLTGRTVTLSSYVKW